MNYSMENHSQWKGGRRVSSDGYVTLHKPKGRSKPIAEHRYMMEKHLGRKLHSYEYVFHKNRLKTDNRIENLQLLDTPYGLFTRIILNILTKIKENYHESNNRNGRQSTS